MWVVLSCARSRCSCCERRRRDRIVIVLVSAVVLVSMIGCVGVRAALDVLWRAYRCA